MRRTRQKKTGNTTDAAVPLQQFLLILFIFGILAITLQAAQPAWWTSSGAVDPNAGTNNFAVINQGQLKQFTQKAVIELNNNLTNGAGSTLNGLVTGWSNYYQTNGYTAANPATNDYKSVNLGQLKYIAKLINTRLYAEGYITNYPSWTQTNSADYNLANIGQAKTIFSFDFDTDANNLPDRWEIQNFGHTGNAPGDQSPAGDGFTILQEYQMGRNPLDYYQGTSPELELISGNGQSVFISTFAYESLIVKVKNSVGATLANAPVQFSMGVGSEGELAATKSGSGSTSVSVRADENGLARAYFKGSATTGNVSIVAQAGTGVPVAHVDFTEQVTNLGTVFAGGNQSFFLKPNGELSAWGANALGQLGLDVQPEITSPTVLVSGGNLAVACRGNHTLFLKLDHTVWTVGNNYFGQLGTGDRANLTSPAQISGLSNIIAVAVGSSHSLALQQGGTVYSWGGNFAGQLGAGTTADGLTPAAVTGITDVVALAAGRAHSLALDGNGHVYAWGDNSYGQLGTGDRVNQSTPTQVTGLNQIIAIVAGDYFSVALQQGGNVYVWGANSSGQLALGHNRVINTPQLIESITDAKAVAAGAEHLVILGEGGNIVASGANLSGQLGTGDETSTNALQSILPNGVNGISVGFDHSLVVKQDGTVLVFGANQSGQLGDGSTLNNATPTPIAMP